MIKVDFVVVGRNYWELDREAGKILESLVGDLEDQRADYDIDCSPRLEAWGRSEPILWEGRVRARVDDIPETREYNVTRRGR